MGDVVFRIDEDEELPKIFWPYLVKLRAGFICQVCSYRPRLISKEDIFSHHRIPVELGGKYTLRNGKCLCYECHTEAHRILLPAVRASRLSRALKKLYEANSKKQQKAA